VREIFFGLGRMDLRVCDGSLIVAQRVHLKAIREGKGQRVEMRSS